VNSTGRHPDAELTGYINNAGRKLYAMAHQGGLLRVQKDFEPTITGAASYTLPTDFLGVIASWLRKDDYSIQMKYHDQYARPFAGPSVDGIGDFAYSYSVAFYNDAWEIEFYPLPTSGDFLVVYIPTYTDLSADGDNLSLFINILSWDELIVTDAAIQAKIKDELPYSDLEAERNRLISSIQSQVELRNMSATHIVRDSRRRSFYDPASVRHGASGDFLFTWPLGNF
jgi:hypothetical protein